VTCANDVLLETTGTVTDRWAPMACGPNVDQARPLPGAAALRLADLARDIPLYRRASPDQRHGGTPAPCRFNYAHDAVAGGIGPGARLLRRPRSKREV